jgi:hypothetical protein
MCWLQLSECCWLSQSNVLVGGFFDPQEENRDMTNTRAAEPPQCFWTSNLPHRQYSVTLAMSGQTCRTIFLAIQGFLDRRSSYEFDLKAQIPCAPLINDQKTDEH